MDAKYYYISSTGNLQKEEVCGPYTALEMLNMNLPGDTFVTDDLDSDRWWTADTFDFAKICEEYAERRTGKRKSYRTFTLKLEGATYLFRYKENEKIRGPRSAKQMHDLNLDPSTPVTEASLDGEWFVAGNFDFGQLIREEEKIKEVSDKLADRNVGVGFIWLIAGLIVTYFSFQISAWGGGIVATGAIVGGFIQMMKGLMGSDGLSKEERSQIYEGGQYDESEDVDCEDASFQDLSHEDLTELYAELGLTPDATNGEIKRAYRNMAKRYHPDMYKGQNEVEKQMVVEKFRNINDAYELIKQMKNLK